MEQIGGTRWVWWLPLGVITLAVALYAFRLGWIAANITETDAIDAYAARYVSEVAGGARTDCTALPGEVYGVWIVLRCIERPADRLHSYYINRFGGLSHQDETGLADPVTATTERPET